MPRPPARQRKMFMSSLYINNRQPIGGMCLVLACLRLYVSQPNLVVNTALECWHSLRPSFWLIL